MKRVVATAADPLFAFHALNLIGSLQGHGYIESVLLYDLGLTNHQRKMFEGIENLTIKKVPAFTPNWRPCYTWKPWVINDAANSAERVLYLDAGAELLESVEHIFKIIEDTGYFLVSQHQSLKKGHVLRDIIPIDYISKYKVPEQVLEKPVIAAGLIGFDSDSRFRKEVVAPWLQHCIEGDNLGWSQQELARNHGIHWVMNPIIRDCPYFRHDQTILNILLYRRYLSPVTQPMELYGSMDLVKNKGQVLWSPKIKGSYKYTDKVKYTKGRLLKKKHNSLSIFFHRTKKRIHK